MRDEFIETGKDSEGTKRQYVGSYIVKRIARGRITSGPAHESQIIYLFSTVQESN